MGKKRKIVRVELSNDPIILTRTVLPNKQITNENKKQFITSVPSSLTSVMNDGTCVTLHARAGYAYDGATIPFNIGKGDMRLLIPALFHDLMCDDKSIIDYNRKLSSEIFKATLIACGVPKWKATVMYTVVDIYQMPLWIKRKKKNG